MATTAADRIDRILEAYLLALAGLDQCPEDAPEIVKKRLGANVERAERAFSDAAAHGPQRAMPPVEAAVLSLGEANQKARSALRDATPIAVLVNDLERATGFAVEALGAITDP